MILVLSSKVLEYASLHSDSVIIQMSGTLLDYTIQGKRQYLLEKGDMGTIHQKSSDGFILSKGLDDFQLTLKMKSSGIVWLIEYFPINAKIVTFQLVSKEEDIIEENLQIIDRPGGKIVEFKSSKVTKRPTAKIRISVNRDQPISGVGIKYILVKGDKNDAKSLMQKANVSRKQQFFVDARESPHAMVRGKQLGVFSQRKKNKEEKPQKLGMSEQQRQYLQAIQLSKQQAQQKGHKLPPQQSRSLHRPIKEEQKPKDYTLVDYDKIKHFFTNVNSTWLQAQRQLEIEKGIPQKNRLSNQIQVRHLNGKTICVDMPQGKKVNIEKLAEDMGAKIVKEVVDNCLLVTSRNDTEKVAKARKCKNVRIVTPNFIEECKQCDAYLNEREYFLKL